MVVKKREGFRPFAPMCCYDDMKNFFTPNIEIPYMNQIVSVNPKYRKKLPSIFNILRNIYYENHYIMQP